MILGNRNTGKSNISLYLVNYLLRFYRKVFLVDLDIGQQMLHVPGTVSLFELDEPILSNLVEQLFRIRP